MKTFLKLDKDDTNVKPTMQFNPADNGKFSTKIITKTTVQTTPSKKKKKKKKIAKITDPSTYFYNCIPQEKSIIKPRTK